MPKVEHGTGWVEDTVDERDYRASTLFGAPFNLPGEASLEKYVRRVRDQGSLSSCVGMAAATAIDVRLRRMGFTSPEPSPLVIYTTARALARSDSSEELFDVGSYPRLAMKGIREIGIVAESKWPLDPSKVNSDLPWDVLQSSSTFRIQAWYRITPSGMGRVAEICNALKQGYPVIFGAAVDYAFIGHTGKGLVPMFDPSKGVGGHMMCIVGYTTRDARTVFRCVNSWGEGWGDHGFYNADDIWMAAETAGDFYVIQVGEGVS